MAAIQKNQLLFNLDVPSMPVNMAAKFHHPEPIIVEKFGSTLGPIITAPKPALQLSVVSEDSLSTAVQLARRDLKKQKEEEQLRASQQLKAKKGKVNSSKGKVVGGRAQITHSDEYKDRMKKRESKKQEVLMIKERQKGSRAKAISTQTTRPNRPSQRKTNHNIPARSMSPPTRDTDPYYASLSGDARTMAEIRKLRTEMDQCLLRIRQVQETARDESASRPANRPVYAEDIEAERKRVVRGEEQAARSARTVYMLTQQVRQIQEDINKIGPDNIKHTKKSQTLNKLVAAHRGAVRALQTFIQHLPDFNLTQGLPRSYHELGLLLRQLSLCCSQLEVVGESNVPESVLNLLKDYEDMNRVLQRDFHTSPKSPPRLCQLAGDIRDKKKRSPASRKLDFGHDQRKASDRSQSRPGPSTVHKPARAVLTVERLSKHTTDRAVDATPDRQAALRAGIAALVRAADSAPSSPRSPRPSRQRSPVPPLDLPVTPRSPGSPRGRGVAWEYPLEKPRLQQWKKGKAKGLLLPSKLQDKRKKVAKPKVPVGEAHYAEPTQSSMLKEVPPDEHPVIYSPPRSPRSPRRLEAVASPRMSGRSPRDLSPRAFSLPDSPRLSGRSRSPGRSRSLGRSRSPGRDILRQVQLDKERAQHKAERAKIDRLRHDLGHSEQWLAAAEDRIWEKLQPILDQAKVEVNADLLADSLLKDLLEDTARELEDEDGDTEAGLCALDMIEAPSMETMIQRLQSMELEQQDIRHRWATLVYEEENMNIPARAKYFDAPLSDQPGSPTPIHLTSQLPPPHHTQFPDHVLNRLESIPTDSQAIMFTKPQPQPKQYSSLQLSELNNGALHIEPVKVETKPGIPIFLSKDVQDSIASYRKTFEHHLKKMSYQSVGRFDPWQIMEEVANEIVEDCMRDVSKELEDINNDIVNQMYTTEFSKVPSPEGAAAVPRAQVSQALPPPDWPHKRQEAGSQDQDGDKSGITGGDCENKLNSHNKAVPTNVRSPSPEIVSETYSYEDDFDGSPRLKSRDETAKSDLSQDSWQSDSK